MTIEARLRILHAGCMTTGFAPGVSVAQLSDEGERSVFLASAASPGDLDDALDGLARTLTGYRVATRSTLTAVVTGACPPHGVESVIRGYNCSILWPAVFADGRERYAVLAPSRDRLRQLVERLAEMGAAEVEAVSDAKADSLGVSVRLGAVFGGLTPRQLEVLRVAVQEGDYASPRRTSTEALSVGFGISRATFEEHLRKAEVKVLEAMMATLAEHPLARAGLKRAGAARAPRARATAGD